MATISLDVSIGEALDKLSILDIKCRKIRDPGRLSYCKAEYDLLYASLKEHIDRFPWHYKVLTWINESIWNIQDEVRIQDSLQQQRLQKYAMRIQDENDMRFRIKDKINKLTQSSIREQKGYAARRAFFLGHLGLGDILNLVGAIRYYSTTHDGVTVVCKRRNAETVRGFFVDDPSIELLLVDDSNENIAPAMGGSPEVFQAITLPYSSVILSGVHKGSHHPWDDISDCFYKDMGLPLEIRRVFHWIPSTDQSLYDLVKDIPYVFVQQKASDTYRPLVTWNKDEILTIDPNINQYPEGHRWYEIGQQCANKPFLAYRSLLEHAREIHLLDSSFSCMVQYMNLEATVIRVYRRQNGSVITHFPRHK